MLFASSYLYPNAEYIHQKSKVGQMVTTAGRMSRVPSHSTTPALKPSLRFIPRVHVQEEASSHATLDHVLRDIKCLDLMKKSNKWNILSIKNQYK